jgi:hypothetical protein
VAKTLLRVSTLILGLVFAASADVVTVHETFASGAAFDGTVTFLPDFSNVTAVDGYLTGGGYGNDHINWIWDADNYASTFGPQYGGNFLMDGTTCGSECGSWQYFITFTWDFSGAPQLVIATPNTDILSPYGGNNVIYNDPLVAGSIESAVPEPGSMGLLALALGGVAILARRRR